MIRFVAQYCQPCWSPGKIRMKRPVQHQIDDAACHQLKQCLPSQWVVRTQSHDYGIDGEIEIFKGADDEDVAESTGTIFKVQIKGTTSASVSSSGETISVQLEIPNVRYLCDELRLPVILVLADIKSRQTWWHAPQMDTDLRDRLQQSEETDRKSLVVHIPAKNRLPSSVPQLVKRITDLELFLASEFITQASMVDFHAMLSSVTDLDAVLESYRAKVAGLRIQRIDRLWSKGDLSAVVTEIGKVLSQSESPSELKFAAILYKEKVMIESARKNRTLQANRIRIESCIASELDAVSKRGPAHLKLLAMIISRTAQLHALSTQDFALFMNWRVHHENLDVPGIDYFTLIYIASARRIVSRKLVRKYVQCVRLINLIPQMDAYNVLVEAVVRLHLGIFPFLYRLSNEAMTEAADSYRRSVLDVSDFAIKVAVNLGQREEAVSIALSCVWLWNTQDERQLNNAIAWARARIDSVGDPDICNPAYKDLDDLVHNMTRQNRERVLQDDIEQERQIYIQMAGSLGINLNDPNDEIASIVRIGLDDLNPERVLRNCEHLFVSLGSCGIPGRMLGLPTAGSKYVHCTKYGYAASSLRLDDAYERLCEQRCKKCADNKPRSAEWRWTRSWQQKEDEMYADFVERTRNW